MTIRKRGANLIATDVYGLTLDEMSIGRFVIAGAAATAAVANGLAVATAMSATEVTSLPITAQPNVPRIVTAVTAASTAGHIKAVSVTVYGTNYDNQPISEELPAFTEDTPGAVTGTKAFKTVTSATVPAMDGTSATVALGYGRGFGLPYTLDSVLQIRNVAFNGALTSNAPTITIDDNEIEKNVITPHASDVLNGAKAYEMDIVV